jgi:hypothetical protein
MGRGGNQTANNLLYGHITSSPETIYQEIIDLLSCKQAEPYSNGLKLYLKNQSKLSKEQQVDSLNIILEQISSRQFFRLRKKYELLKAKYEQRDINKSFKRNIHDPFLPEQMVVNDFALNAAQEIVYNNQKDSFQQILINNLYQRFSIQPNSTQALLINYCSAPRDIYNNDIKSREQ